MNADIAYGYKDGLYLNLTNRCPTACGFCIKRTWRWRYRGWDLKLGCREPSASETWKAVLAFTKGKKPKELVFCGYGECAYRLPVMLRVARLARRRFPRMRLRFTTTGLGSMIWKRDIVPELEACLDSVAISLNTADPEQWVKLHAPLAPFKKRGFDSVLEFIAACARSDLETTVTAVEQPGVDLRAVKKLAIALGADFRPRPYLGKLPPR